MPLATWPPLRPRRGRSPCPSVQGNGGFGSEVDVCRGGRVEELPGRSVDRGCIQGDVVGTDGAEGGSGAGHSGPPEAPVPVGPKAPGRTQEERRGGLWRGRRSGRLVALHAHPLFAPVRVKSVRYFPAVRLRAAERLHRRDRDRLAVQPACPPREASAGCVRLHRPGSVGGGGLSRVDMCAQLHHRGSAKPQYRAPEALYVRKLHPHEAQKRGSVARDGHEGIGQERADRGGGHGIHRDCPVTSRRPQEAQRGGWHKCDLVQAGARSSQTQPPPLWEPCTQTGASRRPIETRPKRLTQNREEARTYQS